jgi:hypothetical protein
MDNRGFPSDKNATTSGKMLVIAVEQEFVKWNNMEPNARWYNWATLFLGEVNIGTWPSRLGESQK